MYYGTKSALFKTLFVPNIFIRYLSCVKTLHKLSYCENSKRALGSSIFIAVAPIKNVWECKSHFIIQRIFIKTFRFMLEISLIYKNCIRFLGPSLVKSLIYDNWKLFNWFSTELKRFNFQKVFLGLFKRLLFKIKLIMIWRNAT